MTDTTYREAITAALAAELESDSAVILLGEDIARAGGVFKTTSGLFERFGGERVMDTPISEQAIVGAAIGAATRGLRPVVEIMFADFAAICFDQIANQLPKLRYTSGGQVALPVTIRLATGASLGFGSQHSQAVENWFLNVPGLRIVTPGDAGSAYGLLRAAIRDPNPVLFFEHKALYGKKGPSGEARPLELGQAAVLREGQDATVVANQLMLHRVLQAAADLSDAGGGELEVIDVRSLAPFDLETVMQSVAKTHRLVCAQEGPYAGSWGASLIGSVAESGFELLDAPPVAVSADPVPLSYAQSLEEATLASPARILEAIGDAIRY